MSAPEYRHSRPTALLEVVGGSRDTFMLLVDIFKRDSVDKLGKMREALTQGDRAQLGFHTHALKGTVGPTGADALLQQLVILEAACKDPQGTYEAKTLDEIALQVEQVCEELERFAATLT